LFWECISIAIIKLFRVYPRTAHKRTGIEGIKMIKPESLGQLWKPPPGFPKPQPNGAACVIVSAKQWNVDNPSVPVTQTMLMQVMRDSYFIKADNAREGLALLQPEEALRLAGWISRGELAGQRKCLADAPDPEDSRK
jgi:hypothetical protein